MIQKLTLLLVFLTISAALGREVRQISNDDNSPTKVTLPMINDASESTTDLQAESDMSNTKAVNLTKPAKPTDSEWTMNLSRKSSTPMMSTNITTMSTTPMMTTLIISTQPPTEMTTTTTTTMMTTTTSPTTTTTTTEMTTEDLMTEETTRFTPAMRRFTTTTMAPSNTNNFLSKIPLLGSLVKGLGVRIKGCRCRLYICSCCTTTKTELLGGDVCFNIYYDPYDFRLGMKLTFDDFPLYERSISQKNIPPRCLPVKLPIDILDGTEFCVRIFNIFTPAGRAAHACFAVQVKIPDFPAIEIQIACVEAGLRGIKFVSFDDHEYAAEKKAFKKSQRLFDQDADPKGMIKLF